MELAETILSQLGGNRFAVMTGANNFCALSGDKDFEGGLYFKIGRNGTRCNAVRIRLAYTDLYTMEFLYQTKPTVKNGFKFGEKVIKRFDDVFCDELQSLFTEVTSLYTHL